MLLFFVPHVQAVHVSFAFHSKSESAFRENRWHEKRTMKEGVSSAAVCECNEKIYVIGGGPSVKVSSDKVQVCYGKSLQQTKVKFY